MMKRALDHNQFAPYSSWKFPLPKDNITGTKKTFRNRSLLSIETDRWFQLISSDNRTAFLIFIFLLLFRFFASVANELVDIFDKPLKRSTDKTKSLTEKAGNNEMEMIWKGRYLKETHAVDGFQRWTR